MFGAVGGVGCNVTYTEVTPTRTIQTVQAGPINVTLLFLSPIEVQFSIAVVRTARVTYVFCS